MKIQERTDPTAAMNWWLSKALMLVRVAAVPTRMIQILTTPSPRLPADEQQPQAVEHHHHGGPLVAEHAERQQNP